MPPALPQGAAVAAVASVAVVLGAMPAPGSSLAPSLDRFTVINSLVFVGYIARSARMTSHVTRHTVVPSSMGNGDARLAHSEGLIGVIYARRWLWRGVPLQKHEIPIATNHEIPMQRRILVIFPPTIVGPSFSYNLMACAAAVVGRRLRRSRCDLDTRRWSAL